MSTEHIIQVYHPGLTDLYFHTFNAQGREWQGQVDTYLGEGDYLVQLYSWLTGEPTETKIVNKADMMIGWLFFTNENEWLYLGNQNIDSPKIKKIAEYIA